MIHARLIVAAAAIGILASCSNPVDDSGCRLSVEPAIVVEIRDARTGSPIAAGARGVVRDGAYLDSLRPYVGIGPSDMQSRQAAPERPGTYSVEVRHEGYRPWAATGVRVTRNQCHVRTATLNATLVPES